MAKKITEMTAKGKVVTYKVPRAKVVDMPTAPAPQTTWQKIKRAGWQ